MIIVKKFIYHKIKSHYQEGMIKGNSSMPIYSQFLLKHDELLTADHLLCPVIENNMCII